jgi:hypothetical protein
LYGIERQLFPIQYYAVKNGFEISQGLFRYFLSSFPKSTSASKMIDKRKGLEQKEIVGYRKAKKKDTCIVKFKACADIIDENGRAPIFGSVSDFAKQFEGFRYSQSPFKQVVENVMVFKKPCKYKSVIDDLMAFEEGDQEISPAVINIEAGRVTFGEKDRENYIKTRNNFKNSTGKIYQNFTLKNKPILSPEQLIKNSKKGRYPSQLFIDSNTADILDKQSGVFNGGSRKNTIYKRKKASNSLADRGFGKAGNIVTCSSYEDSGGCSRINHICDYNKEEHDLLIYSTKVSQKERNNGLESLENKDRFGEGNYSQSPVCSVCDKKYNGINNHVECEDIEGHEVLYLRKEKNDTEKNNHPSLKPVSLNCEVMKLFKQPDICDQKIYIPFAGTFSEVIGAWQAGIKEDNIYCCEMNENYIEIGKKRFEYYQDLGIQKELFN